MISSPIQQSLAEASLTTAYSTLTLSDSNFISSSAVRDAKDGVSRGGGISNGGILTITNSNFILNSADLGGGIYHYGRMVTLTNSEIRGNIATMSGGGLYQDRGEANISSSRLLDNRTGNGGGAVQQMSGIIVISHSCIVNNTDTAINHVIGSEYDASNTSNNWWGAFNGPSGAGPGSRDSVSTEVNFSPFLTSALLGCPLGMSALLRILLPFVAP